MFEGRYVVVRSRDSGVHTGTLAKQEGETVLLTGARRIWKWHGAYTLSEMSQTGISPKSSVAQEVPEILILGVCEIIPCAPAAAVLFQKAKWVAPS